MKSRSLISFLLALVLVVGLIPAVSAAGPYFSEEPVTPTHFYYYGEGYPLPLRASVTAVPSGVTVTWQWYAGSTPYGAPQTGLYSTCIPDTDLGNETYYAEARFSDPTYHPIQTKEVLVSFELDGDPHLCEASFPPNANVSSPILLADATEGEPYSAYLFITSCNPDTIIEIYPGMLPTGLVFNSSSQTISGTPTSSGTYYFTVHAFNPPPEAGIAVQHNVSEEKRFAITVAPATVHECSVVFETYSLPSGTVGTPYTQQIETTSCANPVRITLLGNEPFPAGLTLSESGLISGTPTEAGQFGIVVEAVGGTPNSLHHATQTYQYAFEILNVTTFPFQVVKTDKYGHLLEGAVMRVENSVYANIAYEKTTDVDGSAIFDLPVGSYTISEVIAPSGYQLDNKHQALLVTANGPNTRSITFVNEQLYNVAFDKVDDYGNYLPGAEITVEEANTGKRYVKTTDRSGKASFELPEGEYVAYETKAPEGYQLIEETIAFGISANGPYLPQKTFINAALHEIPFHKTNKEGAPLAGAVIQVTHRQTGERYEQTTDARGNAFFKLPEGAYVAIETLAPEGYSLSKQEFEFSVTANGNSLNDRTFVNEREGGDDVITNPIPVPPDDDDPTTIVDTPTPTTPIPALIKDDHFAYMAGYPDGTFQQDSPMTRAEVIVMFSRLLVEQMTVEGSYTSPFTDVDPNDWYGPAIGYLSKLGVAGGYPDGTFRPHAPVTRAEFAVIASRFDELSAGSKTFIDVLETHWAFGPIVSAAAKGWVGGYPDGTFQPERSITRVEVVTITNRVLERAADRNYVDNNRSSLPRSFSDIPADYWGYYEIMEAANGHDFDKSSGEVWTNLYR